MDGCTVTTLIPSVDQIKTWLSIFGSIVISASLVVSLTPKPTSGTPLARFYKMIEIAALVFGRAKEIGELPPTPELDQSLKDAINLVNNVR